MLFTYLIGTKVYGVVCRRIRRRLYTTVVVMYGGNIIRMKKLTKWFSRTIWKYLRPGNDSATVWNVAQIIGMPRYAIVTAETTLPLPKFFQWRTHYKNSKPIGKYLPWRRKEKKFKRKLSVNGFSFRLKKNNTIYSRF